MSSLQESKEVLYEIALEIDGIADLQAILRRSLKILLQKLCCLGGAIFADHWDQGRHWLEEILVMPSEIKENIIYEHAVNRIATNDVARGKRPRRCRPEGYWEGNTYCYSFDLLGFGVILLFFSQPLDPIFEQSLRPICDKLGEACVAREMAADLMKKRDSLKTDMELSEYFFEHDKFMQEKDSYSRNTRGSTMVGHMAEAFRLQEKLQENSKLTMFLLNAIPTPLFYKDRDGKYLGCNQAFTKVMGMTSDEIAGKTVMELYPNSYGEVYHQKDIELMQNPQHQIYEFKIVDKEGSVKPVVIAKDVFRDESGEVAGVVGVFLDISERISAEVALRESEERYRSLFDNATEGILVAECATHKFHFANPAICRMLGYSQGELIGMHLRDIHPDDSLKRLLSESQTQADGEKVFAADIPCRRKDGNIIYADINTGKVVIQGIEYTIGLFTDITERKRAEETLRRYNHIISSTYDLMSFIDGNYVYQAVNNAYLKAYSKERKEIVGFTVRDLHGQEMFENQLKNNLDRALNGETVQFQSWFDYAGIGRRFMDVVYHPFQEDGGEISGVVVIIHDLTDHRRVEKEKARLEEQYHRAQKAESIGRLAGGVAHDLNNLLSPIIGYGELLLDELNPNDTRREYVDEVLRAGFRARDLVRQLLALSRKQTLAFKVVDINHTICAFDKLLRRTIREDIDIEMFLTSDLPAIMADVGQIEQVIMNLAVNAADAMPDGGMLTIETALADLDEEFASTILDVEPGRYVMLAVSDTGYGMDEATREHIFEPFFSTKGEQGTGLGLATVYGIVKQHNGNIWVNSKPGDGTIFKIYLPATGRELQEENVIRNNVLELRGAEAILLVEDNEQVRSLALAILDRQGYEVIVAENSSQALTILASRQRQVHLLLTDVVMPGINGRELHKKALEKYPDLKALFMSGYNDDIIAHHGVLEDDVDFIQKPFTVNALATKVREVLGKE